MVRDSKRGNSRGLPGRVASNRHECVCYFLKYGRFPIRSFCYNYVAPCVTCVRPSDDVIVTPFAQILHSLRSVRHNYLAITGLPPDRYVVQLSLFLCFSVLQYIHTYTHLLLNIM